MSKKVKEYILREQIGKGAFSSVWSGEHQTSLARIAIKVISKTEMKRQGFTDEMLKAEITIQKSLKHPNIVQLLDHCETANNYYLFMEYCKGGDLQGKLNEVKRFPETEALYYLKQMMNACREMHKQGVIHRDLKPQNFLIDGDMLKVCDFGFATKNRSPSESVGSPSYMAPELLSCTSYNPYTSSVDIWSLGVILYQMLFGSLPFPIKQLKVEDWMENLEQVYRDHSIHNQLYFPPGVTVMGHVKKMLSAMLQVDPHKRCTWQQLFMDPLFSDDLNGSKMSISESLSTYLFSKSRVEANFKRNQREIQKELAIVLPCGSSENSQSAGTSTPSPKTLGAISSSNLMLDAQNEQEVGSQQLNEVLMSEFSRIRLLIRPEDSERYFCRLLDHEWRVSRLSTRLGHSCFQNAKELATNYSMLADEPLQLANKLAATFFELSLASLYLSMNIIGRHYAASSDHGRIFTEVFSAAKDNKLVPPREFCENVHLQSQQEWNLIKKCMENCSKSSSILGIEQSDMLSRIKSLKLEVSPPMDVQSQMQYHSEEVLERFFVETKKLLELGRQIKKHLFTFRDHAKEAIYYLSMLSQFYCSKDPILTEYNTWNFLDRSKLMKTASQIDNLETHYFSEAACFDWSQISNKSMSVEAMTESVKQLYKGLGFQDPTISLLSKVPTQPDYSNPFQ